MPLEDIMQKIISSTGITEDEAAKKIREKQRELSDLVSAEGAAYIVAKEMGLDIISRSRQKMKINELKKDLRSFNLQARVLRIFPAKEYEKEGRKFKVATLVVGDESGEARVVLWDRQTELIEMIKQGQAVEIFGGFTKENNRGEVELRISRFGGIKILKDESIPKVEEISKREPSECVISDIKPNGTYKLRVSFVQLFETENFYEICPQCGFRVKQDTGFECKEHGKVEPATTIVISGVVDDGTGNVRAVFFRDAAAKLVGMEMQDILNKKGKLFESVDVVGKEFLLYGRARVNKMFNRIEFIVSDVAEADSKIEAEKMIGA